MIGMWNGTPEMGKLQVCVRVDKRWKDDDAAEIDGVCVSGIAEPGDAAALYDNGPASNGSAGHGQNPFGGVGDH